MPASRVGGRVVIIDNLDSYTHNLASLVFSVTGSRPLVLLNTEREAYSAALASPQGVLCVILSPGPGRPQCDADVGLCREILSDASLPVFGVCLGYQALAVAHGLPVSHSPYGPTHGQVQPVNHTGNHAMFEGVPQGFLATRYHSLAVCHDDGASPSFPECMLKLAWTDDGVIQAIAHRSLPLWGVQFHPESVCTEHGASLVRNFHRMALAFAPPSPEPLPPSPPPVPPPPSAALGAHHTVVTGSRGLKVLSRSVHASVDAESVYAHLYRDDEWSYWLDTARVQADTGRFSFMGGSDGPLSYHLSYNVATGQVSESTRCGETKVHRTKLLPLLKERLADARCDGDGLPFSFCGGFVGYLGYEMKQDCVDMRGSKNRFKADDEDAKLLFSDRFLAFDHLEGRCYAVALCDESCEASARSWLSSSHHLLTTLSPPSPPSGSIPPVARAGRVGSRGHHREEDDDVAQPEMKGPGTLAFAPLPPSAPPPEPGQGSGPSGHVRGEGGEEDYHEPAGAGGGGGGGFQVERDQGEYEDKVRVCRGQIVEGESYELCLTTKLRSPLRPDPLTLYTTIRHRNQAPYAALLRHGRSRAVCSSSPERFLCVSRNGVVESRPIKGTRGRGASAEEDEGIKKELFGCVKDRAENLMVVDLVRSDLARVCEAGSVSVPKLFGIESYATVHQMVTVVRGQLMGGTCAVDAVENSFPMGSMTGAPKTRTMSLLEDIEGSPRGVYSGTIGYFSVNGAADLSVVIRTVLVSEQGMTVGAGGAITILSDEEDEWREMLLKAASVTQPALEACRWSSLI